MRIYKEIKGLALLEKLGRWNAARLLLYNLWRRNKDNMQLNFWVISECWYVTSENIKNPVIGNNKLVLKFVDTLIEAADYWFGKYGCVENYSALLGYMITLEPMSFYMENDSKDGRLFNMWKNRGYALIEESFRRFDSLIVKIIYYGSRRDHTKECFDERKKFKASAGNYFSEKTEAERYFKRRLTDVSH
ncbi:MAG: hypothetical protein LUD81_07605, partial [Clostridiales bacterium]|nr:hypothetical protein [Clostridiales bacterium]